MAEAIAERVRATMGFEGQALTAGQLVDVQPEMLVDLPGGELDD